MVESSQVFDLAFAFTADVPIGLNLRPSEQVRYLKLVAARESAGVAGDAMPPDLAAGWEILNPSDQMLASIDAEMGGCRAANADARRIC